MQTIRLTHLPLPLFLPLFIMKIKSSNNNTHCHPFFSLSADDVLLERDCKIEVEVGSLYCKTAENAVPSIDLHSKQHFRNTVFFVGMLIVKVGVES